VLDRAPESTKVGNNGAGSFSIPIAVPPGTAGIAPALSLVYNSQSQQNQLLGIGWSLAGLPTIERCAKTFAQDGDRGTVSYDTNDRFCMSGMRLMVINGAYGANLAEYRTEVDSGVKVISYGSAGTGPLYFIAWTKDGRILEFGNSNDSRIEGLNPDGTARAEARVWALNKLQDRKGNYFTVTYTEDLSVSGENTNGGYRPAQIDYTRNETGGLSTNRKVVFEYISGRTDLIPHYMGGGKILTTRLLTHIKTYANNVVVRDYRLTYGVASGTFRSRLTSVSECDSDAPSANCLPGNGQPTWQFAWQDEQRGFSNYQSCEPTAGCNGWPYGGNVNQLARNWVGDFDGDGMSDTASFEGNGTTVKVQLSTGPSGVLHSWSAAMDSTNNVNYIGDFHGDGKSAIISRKDAANANMHFYNGAGFDIQVWPAQLSTNNKRNFIGDFNGDGRADVISWKTSTSVVAHLSSRDVTTQPTSFATVSTWNNIVLDTTNDCNYVGDFNGDGKADIISRIDANTVRVQLSTGTGFTTVTWTAHLNSNRLRNLIGDFNGDGLTDIVSWDTDTTVKVHLSTGKSFDIQTWSSSLDPFNFNFVGDYNGDGLADIIMGTGDLNCGNCSFGAKIHYSTGTGFLIDEIAAPAGPINPFGVNLVGDFNGDGKADIFSGGSYWAGVFYGGRNTLADQQRTGQEFSSPDVIVKIANPYGGATNLTYKPLTDDTVYGKDTGSLGAQYPTVDVQFPLYVVSDMVVANGLGTEYGYQYTYAGAKTHLLGRGLLGFRQMTATDLGADSTTTTFYNQDFPLTGLPSDIQVDRASDGAPFLDTVHGYWNEIAFTSTPPVAPVKFVAPKQLQIKEYDGQQTAGRTTQSNFTYDSYATGNLTVTTHYGDVNFTGDEKREVTDWSVDAGNWLHLPTRRALYTGTSGGVLVRGKWFDYDSAGLLIVEETNAGYARGNANNPKVTYGYDSAFGVRTSVTVHNSANGDPPDCTTTTDYDSTKTFPLTITNCLTHQKTVHYDAGLGVKLDETDPNGAPTSYTYEGFGRLLKVIGPLDNDTYPTVKYDYLNWGDPLAQRVVTSRREEHGGSGVLWSEQYFDGLGRIDQTRSEGPDGKTILTERAFDSRGLVLLQTAPHFDTEDSRAIGVMFDILGRPVREYHSDGTFATTAYAAGVVTQTNERGISKVKVLDAYGQVSRVDELNGSETYHTYYTYDAAGALTSVTNNEGHVTRTSYDLAGRKVAMCDPNMGTPSNVGSCEYLNPPAGAWLYTYSPAGTLLTQKDAITTRGVRDQTLTFTYDRIGRPLTKQQGSITLVQWTYDQSTINPPPTGGDYPIGRVTQVEQPQTDIITRFAYDKVGSTLQTDRRLLGTTWYTMSQTYDALNRITTETFPTETVPPPPGNETVRYTYNSAGWLDNVDGYINHIEYNARGQKTQLQYANGVITDWISDPDTFRVTHRETGLGAAVPAVSERVALSGWSKSWTSEQPPSPPTGYMNLYRGGICVTDGTDASVGGDSTVETGVGSLIGYLKSSGGTGTVPAYRSTCYGSGGSCTAWGLSLDSNGTAVGFLSTTAPDSPSASNPFVQSNGVLLQGLSGTPSAYLWSPQSQLVAQTDHIYNSDGSAPSGYTASGLTAYLEKNSATGNTPLYRYANTAGHHYYSTTSDQPPGFTQDGILGYVRTASDLATTALYRHYSASTGDYVLTTSSTPPTGYTLQATLGYVYTAPAVGSGSYQDLVYHYDQVGNVTAIVDNIFTGSRIFTYDALNRLETAYGYFGDNQAIKDCTYSYSSIGNINNKCGVAFTYGDSLHPSAVTSISTGKSYTYDNNGNMLTGAGRTFTWDVDNRVTSVTMGGVTSMEYDYTGMRVKKDGAGGTTLYPFPGVEIDPNGVMTKFIRIGTETFASKKGTVQYFYHNDHLGGVNVITDITGGRVQLVEYDPWGGVSRSEGNIDPTHKFTGKELDPETGLYYYGGRYYDPEISRFISPDPFVQDEEDPQNLNRYSYVNNDPINYTDPSGYFYMGKGIADGPGGSSGIFMRVLGGIVGFLNGGIWGALVGSGVIDSSFGMSSNAIHVAQILGGIMSLLGGNPGGMFQISAGAVGLSGTPGSGGVSGMLSSLGDLTLGLARGSGGAGTGGAFRLAAGSDELKPALTGDYSGLFFNGRSLSVYSGGKETQRWPAYSGTGWCMNNPACQKMYRVGPIPEGNYFADPNKIERISLADDIAGRFGRGRWLGGIDSWGPMRVELDIAPGTVIAPRTGGFYIHGGSVPGSAGCIDLCTWSKGFFDYLSGQPRPVPLTVKY
jgi:RHS repeat-associated protein